VYLGDMPMASVTALNKKDSKKKAAEVALRYINNLFEVI
jgi:hypothetical protein